MIKNLIGLVLLVFLVSLLITGCSGKAGNAIAPAPAPASTKAGTLTAEEVISQILENPNEYPVGAMLNISGIITHEGSAAAWWLIYLGPTIKDLYVIVKVNGRDFDQITDIRSAVGSKGMKFAFRGKYEGVRKLGDFLDCTGPVFEFSKRIY